jgi:hypothetical protein
LLSSSITVWNSKFVIVDFMFATTREMKFEMSSEVKIATAQSYRNGGGDLRKYKHVET